MPAVGDAVEPTGYLSTWPPMVASTRPRQPSPVAVSWLACMPSLYQRSASVVWPWRFQAAYSQPAGR